jgi:hypothetical protein
MHETTNTRNYPMIAGRKRIRKDTENENEIDRNFSQWIDRCAAGAQ